MGGLSATGRVQQCCAERLLDPGHADFLSDAVQFHVSVSAGGMQESLDRFGILEVLCLSWKLL